MEVRLSDRDGEGADVTTSDLAWELLKPAKQGGLTTRQTGVQILGGEVLHAVDGDRRRHLLIPVDASVDVLDRASKGVTVETRDLLGVESDGKLRFIDVRCEEPRLNDIFSIFCDELLENLTSIPRSAGDVVIDAMIRWRDLLGPASSPLLSDEAIKGLVGEMHFLERVAALDPDVALSVWTGVDKARHDFTGRGLAVEVKASSAADVIRVRIHGLGQLEEPAEGGNLYLHIERFEKVPHDGDCIPDAVERLVGLGVARRDLLAALNKVGAHPADFPAYARVRYATLETVTYKVDVDFPRLTPVSVANPAVLSRLSNVEYTLDLAGEPPAPLKGSDLPDLPLEIVESLRGEG